MARLYGIVLAPVDIINQVVDSFSVSVDGNTFEYRDTVEYTLAGLKIELTTDATYDYAGVDQVGGFTPKFLSEWLTEVKEEILDCTDVSCTETPVVVPSGRPQYPITATGSWAVVCPCGIRGPIKDTQALAIESWNLLPR